METSKQTCIVLNDEYKGDDMNLKLSYPANYFDNLEDPDLSHANENGISDNYAEIYSPAGSISSSESVEIPYDIPDNQKYHDLGAYISSVVAACKNESLNPIKLCPQLSQEGTAHLTNVQLTESNDDVVLDPSTDIDTTDTSNIMGINNKHDSHSSPLPQQDLEEAVPSDLFNDPHTDGNFAEEFADFVSNGPVDENWATFSPEVHQDEADVVDDKPPVSNFRNSLESEDDNDDFGDFTNCEPSIVSASITSVNIPNNFEPMKKEQTSTLGILERLLQKLEPSLDKAFGVHLNHQTSGNPNASTVTRKSNKLYTNVNKSVDTSNNVSSLSNSASGIITNRIWCRLCNPDRLPEINQQWWKSPIFMTYLNAIDVNPQNSIPAFASQLRLLEPVRLNSQDSQKHTTLNDNFTNQEQHINVLSMADNYNDKPSSNNSSMSSTNYNDTDSKVNQVLDLDFFETRETQNKPNSQTNGSVKHTELSDLEAELSAFTIPPPMTTTTTTTSSATTTTTVKPLPLLVEADLKLLEINKRSKLSESVRSTLNRLPMINYMRSKRLMFPVQQHTQE
ncbi:unnamed protein product [Schistosoma turkestanicum]|nr:unnamed protein product [Schistosoma turkestanicum]